MRGLRDLILDVLLTAEVHVLAPKITSMGQAQGPIRLDDCRALTDALLVALAAEAPQ